MAPTPPPAHDALHVLVTGFGPFRNFPENPAWLAVRPLADAILTTTSASGAAREVRVTALQVPVAYAAVLDTVPGLHAAPPVLPSSSSSSSGTNADADADAGLTGELPEAGFDFILHVGVAGPGGLALERRAHKLGYTQADATGALAPSVGETRGFGAGYEGLPSELATGIDVEGLRAHLRAAGTENVRVSDDAGRYLCEFIFYAGLAQAARADAAGARGVPVLFLHVCPVDRPYATARVTDAIREIVGWVAARL